MILISTLAFNLLQAFYLQQCMYMHKYMYTHTGRTPHLVATLTFITHSGRVISNMQTALSVLAHGIIMY